MDVSSSTVFVRHHEIAQWSEQIAGAIKDARLLIEAAEAKTFLCTGCDKVCLCDVEYAPAEEGESARPYAVSKDCEYAPFPINPEVLRQWRVSITAFVRIITTLCGLGIPEEIIPYRLWRLGQLDCADFLVDLFLAFGVSESDAQSIFEDALSLRRYAVPVVLVLWYLPEEHVFGPTARVIALSDFISLNERGLQCNLSGLRKAVTLSQSDSLLTAAATSSTSENLFRCDGATWTVRFEKIIKTVRDCKGMHYIAFLLEHSGEEFHVLELDREVNGRLLPNLTYSAMTAAQLETEGMSPEGHTSQRELMDPEYEAAVKKEIHDLQQQRDMAETRNDEDAAAELQNEIEQRMDAYAAAHLKCGKSREFVDKGERVRQRVSKAIRIALKNIKEKHLALYTHLESSMLPLGYTVRYNPAIQIMWDFK